MKEAKIKYPQEFKDKCFNNLRFAVGDIRLLMSAIENGRDDAVRYMLEKTLEDPELFVGEKIEDDGSRKVANARIHAHKVRQEIYNEYMELLTETIDNYVGSKLLR
jgi:hypothetical protein